MRLLVLVFTFSFRVWSSVTSNWTFFPPFKQCEQTANMAPLSNKYAEGKIVLFITVSNHEKIAQIVYIFLIS